MVRFFRKPIAIVVTIVVLIAIGIFARYASADFEVYYFNNAVNQSPSELGNYWLDADATDPALSLPNYDDDGDELRILPGAVYDGDAYFYSSGENRGTVTGDVTFYENGPDTDMIGTVLGTKYIVFRSETTTTYNFTTSAPWVVVADGVTMNLSNATYDSNSTFTEENGGSFIFTEKYRTYANSENIYVEYKHDLDSSSVPSTGDFVVTVNGVSASVASVSVTGKIFSVRPSIAMAPGDDITFSYTPGVNKIKSLIGQQDQDAITGINVIYSMPLATGFAPGFSSVYGTKLFTLSADINSSSYGKITVFDTTDDSVITHIDLGDTGFTIAVANKKLYVARATTVSVYSADTYASLATITVGNSPVPFHVAGQKLYVGNYGENTVSVIDTTTDTVTATLTVDNGPAGFTQVGTKLYVNNFNGATVSVIDTLTDTVVDTITSINNPYYSVAVGSKLYVANNDNANTLTVVDTETDTIIDTIPVSTHPYFILAVGSKIYVPSGSTGQVSVVDTNTDTVIETISSGAQPIYMVAAEKNLYIMRSSDGSIDVVDTTIDEIVANVETDSPNAGYGYVVGSKVYIAINNRLIVLDNTTLPHHIPALRSFSSSKASGNYVVGDTIPITATFDRNIKSGSTMTVALNSGGSATLTNVSGATLTGTYTIGANDATPDLAVSSVTSASVTDFANTRTRTSYTIPSSQGNFEAENSFIARNIGDAKNIEIGSYRTVTVGDKPYQVSGKITVGGTGYVYVANQGAGTVSVVRLSDNTVVDTIDVGDEPYGLTSISLSGTTYIYVANTGSDTVSVINTSTNTISATIAVGIKPYYVERIGTTVYVTNGGDNTVSVIDTDSNEVSETIAVGSYPRGIKAHGTDLYVANYGSQNYSGGNYITVIDSTTNEVVDSVLLPGESEGPRGVTVLGSYVYVANYRSHNVSVIDTATNRVIETIPVGNGPRGMTGVGTTIYVENFDDGTISVIDTNDNTVTETIDVGHSPAGMSVVDTSIYYTRFQDNKLGILDTATKTLVEGDPVIIPNTSGGSYGGGLIYLAPPIFPIFPTLPPTVENQNVAIPSADFSKLYPNLFAETKNLKTGMSSKSILELQKYLNAHGFILAKTGPGSPGKETNFFGKATKAALIKFQEAHAKEILIPSKLKKGTGIFGPSTKKYILLHP